MTSTQKIWRVLIGVGLPVAAGCALYLAVAGFDDAGLRALLRLTARLAFMLFVVVFVARPLRQLLPSPWTAALLRERRYAGVAFAAVHSVHLLLIGLRFGTNPELEYPVGSALVGGSAYALMYLMLVTSFDAPARWLGPTRWRRLHKTGLYTIGFVFLATLLPEPGTPLLTWDRAWFVALTTLAVFLRLAAWFAGRSKRRPRDV